MTPEIFTSDGYVGVPLDERTREIAKEAAREAVREHMATCPIFAEFRTLHTDVYGLPGNKDASPGLIGEVADLKRSRRNLWIAVQASWMLIVAAVGAWLKGKV